LDEVAGKAQYKRSECTCVIGDATNEDYVETVVREVIQKYKELDIAILNVGIGPPSNTLNGTSKTFKYCMEANYYSFLNFYVPVIRQMKKQTGSCLIAHMNSQASWFGIPMQGDYTAAKAAVHIFIETARIELKHFGIKHIKLQTIHPGFVATEAVQNDGIPAPNEISEEAATNHVLRRIKNEMNENIFPPATKWAAKLGKILPTRLLTKILLSQTPQNF
jgi:NAD(P)-dependent dehydrogenase (short-subunit alcohol dehydrogenase family)